MVCISVISCSVKDKADNDSSTISLLKDVNERIEPMSVFEEFEYVTLETTDQSLFGAIDKLIVFDDNYYILDKAKKKQILVFSKDGAFVRTIGDIGKGPGEYTNIEDFTIDETTKNIILLCFPSTSITYDNKGQFLGRKKLTSTALLWNICSYKDGYICSSNHQSVLKGDEAFLLFNFDKGFNLRERSQNVLPAYISIPPFISNPVLNVGGNIAYFDAFTSMVHFNVNHKEVKTFRLDFGGKEVPLELYTNTQEFFSKQGEYRFFIDAIIADSVLFTSFANCGKRYVSIVDFETNRVLTYENYTWYPDKLLFYEDEYFYSSYNPQSVIKDCDITFTKKTTNYPLDINSNPVILKFKAKPL